MKNKNIVMVKDIAIGGNNPAVFIFGPCQLEKRDHAMMMAERITNVCEITKTKFIFKSSFDKANRSSIKSKRGIGLEDGLKILAEIRDRFGCPIITDIHETSHCNPTAEVVDALQIPAFLSRQTDLLVAAGNTSKPINIKKGQFLSPSEMHNVAEKVASTGNKNILLCERGTSFGYNNLVNDFRGIEIMAKTGYPIIFDATHSVQHPGGLGSSSGGEREFVAPLARAACAVGIAGLFIETHEDPDNAPSDGANMVDLRDLQPLIEELRDFDALRKGL